MPIKEFCFLVWLSVETDEYKRNKIWRHDSKWATHLVFGYSNKNLEDPLIDILTAFVMESLLPNKLSINSFWSIMLVFCWRTVLDFHSCIAVVDDVGHNVNHIFINWDPSIVKNRTGFSGCHQSVLTVRTNRISEYQNTVSRYHAGVYHDYIFTVL